MFQDKAQPAVNGCSLNKGCTNPPGADWDICEPPSGRDDKPSSAVLRLLARARHSLRDAPCS